MVDQATKQDEKLKPPPPPSKEEAIAAIRRLRAKPVDWDIVNRDERGDEFFSTKNLADWGVLSRDTYIMWLLTKHNAINWNEVILISYERDLKDFDKLKNTLADREARKQLPRPWRLTMVDDVVDDFRQRHYIYSANHAAEINALKKEWLQIEKENR